jgi:hypothetical protein
MGLVDVPDLKHLGLVDNQTQYNMGLANVSYQKHLGLTISQI